MSWMFYGKCVACQRTFGFNPNHVPSITVDGEREPVCRGCFAKWEKLHPNTGYRLHPDAYAPTEEEIR